MNLGKTLEINNQYAELFGSANEAQKRVIEEAAQIGKLLVFEDHEEIIVDGNNHTALRAANMFKDVYGIKVGARINMDNVCYSDGSALAIAILVGLNRFWELKRPLEKLVQLSTILRGA